MTAPAHLTVAALAEYLGKTPAAIYCMNSRGTGPTRIRVGKEVRYRVADVEAWEATRVVRPRARRMTAAQAAPHAA